ncbi:hypothetical protein [Mucilaginibacter humi]|uniref:hypothetical protein n=1 Tax=Mucilaginibacter humi TaxID=2732510 RepID=UPI00293C09E6|nr:hypothetical protein [Mucilaginibacter humi]
MVLVGLAVGAAMVSRIAKNFQDYFTNIIVLKTGAQMYSDGLKHSLELPYQVFEDQRSGETLGRFAKGAPGLREIYNLIHQRIICEFGGDDICNCLFTKSKLSGYLGLL